MVQKSHTMPVGQRSPQEDGEEQVIGRSRV